MFDKNEFASCSIVFFSEPDLGPVSGDLESLLLGHPAILTEENGKGYGWNSCRDNRLDWVSTWGDIKTTNSAWVGRLGEPVPINGRLQ